LFKAQWLGSKIEISPAKRDCPGRYDNDFAALISDRRKVFDERGKPAPFDGTVGRLDDERRADLDDDAPCPCECETHGRHVSSSASTASAAEARPAPIDLSNAFIAASTPSPVAPEIRIGDLRTRRLNSASLTERSSLATASILLNATISGFSASR